MTTPQDLTPPTAKAPSNESGAAAPFTPLPPEAAAASSPLEVARKAHSIPALDGVRAIAASLVFLVHFQAAFGHLLGDRLSVAGRAGRYIADIGYNGVNIFFG